MNPITYVGALVLSLLPAAASAELDLPVDPEAERSMGIRFFTDPGGTTYASWVEQREGHSRLLFAALEEGAWGPAREVASGDDWMLNWADYPTVARAADGSMAATWLESAGRPDSWDYRAKVAVSPDGERWSAARTLHEDEVGPEYGFVSLVATGPGRFGAVWLDSRNMTAGHGDEHGSGSMALYFRSIEATAGAAELGPELMLDGRTCECCNTSAVAGPDGALVVAYRDRAEGEIRDISVARLGGAAGFEVGGPRGDGWMIPGCPVNGPSLAAHGDGLALAWFTGAEGKAAVRAARSTDGGASFGFPQRLDLGAPLGRVASCMEADGSLAVAWLEAPGEGTEARWMLRRVSSAGKLGEAVAITAAATDRASGFPALAALGGGGLVFGWTEVDGRRTSVHTKRLD